MKRNVGCRPWYRLKFLSLLTVAIITTAASAHAASDDFNNWDEPSPSASAFHFENDVWEAGLDAGYGFALGPKEIDQTIQSNLLTQFIAANPTFDPGLTPYETVSGDLHDALVSQIHIYRRVSSWLSVGLVTDYQNESVNIPFQTSFDGDAVDIPNYSWRTHILQIMPSVKFGPALGSFRPYLTAGVGWAFVEQWAFLDYGQTFIGPSFGDTEDDNVSGYRRDNFLAANAGAGVEFGMPDNLSLGLGVRYDQIFAPNPKGGFIFIVPSTQFDYHF